MMLRNCFNLVIMSVYLYFNNFYWLRKDLQFCNFAKTADD